MLSLVKIQALIPLLLFISFPYRQIKAENELDHSLESSTQLTTSEISEDVMDQNLNWNCARLQAFQDVEKIFNMTDDSVEANVNREEYHSRIKRCTEKERQDRITREFERRNQKHEKGNMLKEIRSKNKIRKTTIHESENQKYYSPNTNADSTLLDDLYQTTRMLNFESTEPHPRKYRTLPVNSKPFTNDLSSTSVSQNDESASTEPASFTNSVKKLSEIFKEDQRNIVSSSQKNSFSRETKVDETLSLSTAPDIKPKMPKKNNPGSRQTKITENEGKRKKGLLRALLDRVKEVMEGGTSKNSVDLKEPDSDEKSSSTDPDVESIEYETVTAHKSFDHIPKSSSEISSGGRSHDQQENSIIQKIRQDTKQKLQSAIEELEELRKKMAEFIRSAQSTKNQTQNSIQKATTLKVPSKHLPKQHFPEKHTTLSSSTPTQSFEKQEKSASGSQITLKNLPTVRINFHNLHTTVLPSTKIHSSEHHHTSHERPLKTHLQIADVSKNQNQKDSLLQARSEGNTNSNHHPHNTENALSAASIKRREHSAKFGSTPSMINILQTQKPIHQFGLPSEGPAITQSLHLTKNKPEVLFQTSSTKIPSLSTLLRHGIFSKEPAMIEYPNLGKRSTPQTSEIKLPTTGPISIPKERATFPERSTYDETSTTHFHSNYENPSKSTPVVSEEVELKTVSISKHKKPFEESTASLNHHTTKVNSLWSLNGRDASSGLVDKSYPSTDDQLRHIHHLTMIPKSTTELLLEKITQLTPFYKVEEWEKIITPRKHDFNEISTHQPIRSHKDVSPENILTEKFNVNSSILPLVHRHSHHIDLSETSASESPHSPLKETTHQKSSPSIHSHLNMKHLDENFTSHPVHPIEVTLSMKHDTENHSIHQPNHHSFHWTEMPSKKVTLEKAQDQSSSTFYGIHSPKFKDSDEDFISRPHLSIEVTSPMKSSTETHLVHQINHHHSNEMPSKKNTLEKALEESRSTSHVSYSPKFKSDENFTPHSTHSIGATSSIKFSAENHPIHQSSHHHSSHLIEMPSKKNTLEKVLEESRSTSHLVHSPKFQSDENFTPHSTHSIGATSSIKSRAENYPVHQSSHHHSPHLIEMSSKKNTLEKALEEMKSTSHVSHSPKFKSDENFTPHSTHSIGVTSPMKSNTENYPVHQPNHNHLPHSTEMPSKKNALEKALEESRSTSHLLHSPKFQSDENFTPHSTHSIGVTSSIKSSAENHPNHRLSDHPFHSTYVPLKAITLKEVQEAISSTPHLHHTPKFKSDENFTPHTHLSFEVILPMKFQTENHPVHQPNHHPSHSIEMPLKKLTLKKTLEESSSISHGVHSPKFKSDENFTPHPHLSFDVTLPMKSYTENHPVHHPNHRHHDFPKFDKISTLQPSHSTEPFLNKITSLEKAQVESSSFFHSVHSPSTSKHIHEIFTPHPPHSTEVHVRRFTSPMEPHSEIQAIPLHFGKTSTLLPSFSTKMGSKDVYLPQRSDKIPHVTPLPHSSTTQMKKIDAPPPNTLEEIKRRLKEKMEEIKNLQKKHLEVIRKSHPHHNSDTTLPDFDVIFEQKPSKHSIIDSTPSQKETHSTKNPVQGRSGSEQSIKTHHLPHDTSKPYPAHFTTPTILPNDEMVEMPLPPLNPNDNWKYLKKLDEWYEKQKAKSSTPKPPTIRPPSAIPTPRPRSTPYSPTIAPTTDPARLRPTTPSRNRTAPNQRSNTRVTPTTTQKPPPPVNYHINSTVNRTYNITINMVTPDSTMREDEKRNDEEGRDPSFSDFPNEAGFGNGVDMVRSTGPPKIANESTGDFDSLPHTSLPRELQSKSSFLPDSPSVDETTPLPSSFITPTLSGEPISPLQMKISPKDDSSLAFDLAENNTILQSSIHFDAKGPKHPPSSTASHKKITDKLKKLSSKVQTDSVTPASITLAADGRTDLTVSSHLLPSVGNCTPACNNYIIIIPNKTEEIIQILHKSDQTPITDQSAVRQASRSTQNDQTSDTNSPSDIKSFIEPIIKAKMTPSNNTELRKSINELMTSLKQRRFNEYAKLYQYRLNPMVGEGRNSIVAITQINEYIELLELMLVYLARDPDKLLDEKKDARIDNFESPYTKDDPQRRLIEDQFHYVHPKILNEFIDVYKKYSKGERYYGRPSWQFSQENDQRGGSRPRTSGGLMSNLFNFRGLVQPLIYNRTPMDRPNIQYYDD